MRFSWFDALLWVIAITLLIPLVMGFSESISRALNP